MVFVWVAVAVAAAVIFLLVIYLVRLGRKKSVEQVHEVFSFVPTDAAAVEQPDTGGSGSCIPPLLHRVWIGKKQFPPYKAVAAVSSFDRTDGSVRKILWNDRAIAQLLENRFPDLRDIYRNYQFTMQRVNLTKYMTMYEYGGIYADLDVVAHRSLDGLLEQYPDQGAIFFVETVLTPEKARSVGEKNEIRKRGVEQGMLGTVDEDQRRIASYLFLARPKHPLVKDMLEEAKKRSVLRVHYPYDIMYTSGTDLFTTVINHKSGQYDDVLILDRSVADEYFNHICFGSWVNFIDFPFKT